MTQLILQYGLPLALKLADKWGSNDPVTPEEKAELRAMAANTPQSVMVARLTAAGISPDSPEGKALLKLLPPGVVVLPG